MALSNDRLRRRRAHAAKAIGLCTIALLATLMGLRAGLDALNFEGIRGPELRRYISAIHAAATTMDQWWRCLRTS